MIDLAEHTVSIDLDIAKLDSSGVVRVDHRRALGLDAFALGIDQKQRQSIALAGGARGAGRHDQQIGGVAVDHKGLGAAEPEAVAGAHRRHLSLQRAMLGAFVDGKRGQQRTIRDLRQVLGFLRGAAAARQGGSREHGCA